MLAWITWDPPRFIFTVPIIDRPIAYYGLCFVLGFFIGYMLLIPILKKRLIPEHRQSARDIADRLIWYIMIGTLVGARLGHVFFYEWPLYRQHPWEIFKVWEGGLASHGGTVGVILALFLFQRRNRVRFPEISFLRLLDMVSIPVAMAAVWIRIGNFFNQEILGPPTTVPWGIIFGHPYDGGAIVPRHPAMLYEALAYLATFAVLFILWKRKGDRLQPGYLTGLFMLCVFGSRFLLEFLKLPSSLTIDESVLQAGQLLSIPFILLGAGLIAYARKTAAEANT